MGCGYKESVTQQVVEDGNSSWRGGGEGGGWVFVESEWKPAAGPETPLPNRCSCTPKTFADKKQMRNWESSGSQPSFL